MRHIRQVKMEDVTRVEKQWIFSKNADFWAHIMPIVAGVCGAPFVYKYVDLDAMPLWAYLIVVVFCDVGHVWTTLFRCYLDTEEFRRRWFLYTASPLLVFLSIFLVHFKISEAICWTVIGYIAIFHFVRQQWGFLCLYRARAGETTGRVADRLTHLTGAMCPIVYWHSDPSRSFDWFLREDYFLVRFPREFQSISVAVWVVVAAWYTFRQISLAKQGVDHTAKCMTMAFCWVTWVVGVLCPHKLIGVFFMNMFHAAPSYMIVYYTTRNKWRLQTPPTDAERFMQWCTLPGRWPFYLLFFVAIAVVEEVIWEAFIWRDYFQDVFTFEVTPMGKSFFTALLSLPQVTHYVLDAFIWKVESNPGLSDYYGLTYTIPAKRLE